jgi:glycerol-3-phosphate dehydrogenase
MSSAQQRTDQLARLWGDGDVVHDVLVVGGGINGAVTTASLAARGVKVALVDRGDFASETSQESSNLAWGGIKYLETYEFGLVRKLCVSRNHLIESHPSQVREVRFFVAHERGFRHGRLKLFMGALLYWFIGNFFTKPPRLLSTSIIAREEPEIKTAPLTGGFEYSDAFLVDNDARFVWTFVRNALDRGAIAVNYVALEAAVRDGDTWRVTLHDKRTGQRKDVRAKVLVNAAGPWVDVVNRTVGKSTKHRHVLSKGIHLIVPRITDNERVLTFFADDGRLFFAIPMGHRTCVGTTDTRTTDPDVGVTDEDRRFVLDNINKRLQLKRPLSLDDVIAERCGVRPLVVSGQGAAGADWFQLSRKHVVEVDDENALVSIFGGKLTDCINVGEELARAVASLGKALGIVLSPPYKAWYGEDRADERAAFFARATALGLDVESAATESAAARLWRRFGTDAHALLDAIEADPAEREPALPGIAEMRCEARRQGQRELVVTLADWLRRRTRVALTADSAALDERALRALAVLLFGDDADARVREHLQSPQPERPAPNARVPAPASPSTSKALAATL